MRQINGDGGLCSVASPNSFYSFQSLRRALRFLHCID